MKDEKIEISPWGELMTEKYLNQQVIENKTTLTTSDIQKRIRESRKKEIGSGRSLVNLIRKDDKADDEAIEALGRMLTKHSVLFVRDCGISPDCENYLQFEDFFTNFYHYSLYMYSTDNIGEECIDDLILLAKSYQRNPETFRVVVENDLPIEMLDEFQDWMGYFGDHPKAPKILEDIVTSAVAVICGTMVEPK